MDTDINIDLDMDTDMDGDMDMDMDMDRDMDMVIDTDMNMDMEFFAPHQLKNRLREPISSSCLRKTALRPQLNTISEKYGAALYRTAVLR
jgi:hypothetical protein